MTEWLRSRALDWAAAGEFADELATARASGRAHVLDLSTQALCEAAQPRAVRLNRQALLVVTNLLVGEYQHVPIELHLTDEPSLLVQLARGGVLFALAARQGACLPSGDAAPHRWAGRYNPRDKYHRQLAFRFPSSLDLDVARAAVQRYLLGLPNTHERSYEELEMIKKDPIQRWLTQRMTLSDAGNPSISRIVENCGYVLTELLMNTKDHAAITGDPRGKSVALMYATLGGGVQSHNRMYFTALDNGVGIVRSIQQNYSDRSRDSSSALSDLLLGELPVRFGNRGFGIPDIRSICDDSSLHGETASITVASSDPDNPGGAAWAQYHSDEGLCTTGTAPSVPLSGTLVHVMLPIGVRLGDTADESDRLELDIEPEELAAV